MISQSAYDIVQAIGDGKYSAEELIKETLAAVQAINPSLNAFTWLCEDRAVAEARNIDVIRRNGDPLPPLAGVPYAVKDLFDVSGRVTLAGSRILQSRHPAESDAMAVKRMRATGAVLVGVTNMDEFACGFTTENSHYGATRNPHDLKRIAGGSSGGSAAAVAAGLTQLSLGTDTNGSIRVPASLSGVFGLKPTFGRLSRGGTFPFVASLDCVGPFARSVADLALCYDALQGADANDPVYVNRTIEPTLPEISKGAQNLRIGVLSGYFDDNASPEARAARDLALAGFENVQMVTLPEVERSRACASIVTASEGATPHIDAIKFGANDFDPMTRERFLAGALIPAAWLHQAQRFRRWFLEQVCEVFDTVDVLLSPTTPWPATPIGASTHELNGEKLIVARTLGYLTQPISLIGLPAVSAPIPVEGALPIGVQIAAPHWREDLVLRAAYELERAGISYCPKVP